MLLLATAGHVDHGKSTLVRALTGMEPDRWAEERRRGMTIDLGYAWTTLPGGVEIAFVDVPGHERFIANMLAGLAPLSAVLLVVSADEGWRALTEEHVRAIDALGIRHGVVAVTRSDLADPVAAMTDVKHRLATTSLADAPVLAVSPITGQGMAALRTALSQLASTVPVADPQAPVRLWVDRSFVVAGHGLVITGSLTAGTIAVGDTLDLCDRGVTIRVRGLHSRNQPVDALAAPARAALNLRGVDRDDVRRGDALLTIGAWTLTDTVDVALRPTGPKVPAQPVLHIGTAEVPVRVRPLRPGTARLRLARPLPWHVDDVAVLRAPGAQHVLASVQVRDVRPPPLRRRGDAARRHAELADRPGGLSSQLQRHGVMDRRTLSAMGIAVDVAPVAGEWVVDPRSWAAKRTALADLVERYAQAHPLSPGLPVDVATSDLGLPDRELVSALTTAPLEIVAGRIYGRHRHVAYSPDTTSALDELVRRLTAAPFAAPEAAQLAALGLTAPILAATCRDGLLVRLDGDLYLLPTAEDLAVDILGQLPAPFTLSQARDALSTTRRVAVPLLEYLDARRRTRRVDALHRVVTAT